MTRIHGSYDKVIMRYEKKGKWRPPKIYVFKCQKCGRRFTWTSKNVVCLCGAKLTGVLKESKVMQG